VRVKRSCNAHSALLNAAAAAAELPSITAATIASTVTCYYLLATRGEANLCIQMGCCNGFEQCCRTAATRRQWAKWHMRVSKILKYTIHAIHIDCSALDTYSCCKAIDRCFACSVLCRDHGHATLRTCCMRLPSRCYSDTADSNEGLGWR
jgi:hypothetical protein